MAKRSCVHPECDQTPHCRDRCHNHYYQWRMQQLADIQCTVQDCGRPIGNVARQLCNRHNARFLKYGDPTVTGRPDLDQPLEVRFWSKVDKGGPFGCWVWTASLNSTGYGQFIVMRGKRGYPRPAHRVAWELIRGPVAVGHVLDHLCRNRACVRPDHLEPVTNEENIQRGVWQPVINARKTHCHRGHEFNEENTYRPARGVRQCRECARIRRRERKAVTA